MSANSEVSKVAFHFVASQTDKNGPYRNSGSVTEVLVLSADGPQVVVTEAPNAIQQTLGPIELQLGDEGAKSGEIDFLGDDVFSGGTTLFGGVVGIGANQSLGSGALTFSGDATLLAKANVTFSNAVNIHANSDATFAADAGVTLTLAPFAWTIGDTLPSTLTFGATGHSGTVALQAETPIPLAIDDRVVVAGGTLQLASDADLTPFGDVGLVTLAAGATLDLHGGNFSIDNLDGAGAISNSAAGTHSTLYFGGAPGESSLSIFTGSIQDGDGTVGVNVGGFGSTLLLTGANHYSGGTTIESGGFLVLGYNSQAALTGSITIEGADGGSLGGNFWINSGATFSGTVRFAGAGARLTAFDQKGIVAAGDGATVNLVNSTASLSGGGDLVSVYDGEVHLSDTGGLWDNVIGTNDVIEATHALVNLTEGGDDTINLDGTDSQVRIYGAPSQWDTINGSGSQITLATAQVRVFGAGDAITASAQSWIEPYDTGANADTVNASGAEISLNAARASVVGGDDFITATTGSNLSLSGASVEHDTVYANGDEIDVDASQAWIYGGGNTITATAGSSLDLYLTGESADVVTTSNATVVLHGGRASITGGGDSIEASAGSTLSLSGTNGQQDTVTGSQAHIDMTASQASIAGGGFIIDATSGSSLSLSSTQGVSDTVFASDDQINLTAAQASILGGGNTIDASVGSAIDLFKTEGAWDTVHAANSQIDLTSAQATILGGGDAIDAKSGSQISLADTSGVWDTVHGDYELITVNSSQASIFGGGNVIDASASSLVGLYATNGVVDQVSGSRLNLILNDAYASLTGGDDTVFLYGANSLGLKGSHETLAFGPALGLDTISGFNASDTLRLSAADWSSFSALQASGALQQHGADTIISTGAGNTLTLVNTAAASLTAAQFAFV